MIVGSGSHRTDGGRPDACVSIAALTPTICHLMGIRRPRLCKCEAVEAVAQAHGQAGGAAVERCLIYAPDAIGRVFLERHPQVLSTISHMAPVVVPMRSVFPPKTPVCFASMFTGAPPEIHGIRAYERPVLECDTLFDTLIESGKRPSIVTVDDSSADIIFRGRDMDYFSESCDGKVTERVLGLLDGDRHDFILAYHQAYDDTLHEATPWGPEAFAAVECHVAAFTRMIAAARRCWEGRAGLIAFAPDHGAHVDPESGKGAHGDDVPEDMELLHFFGFM